MYLRMTSPWMTTSFFNPCVQGGNLTYFSKFTEKFLNSSLKYVSNLAVAIPVTSTSPLSP